MSLYAYGTFLIGICLIAFLGFTFAYAYGYVAAIGQKTAIDLGTYDAEQQSVNTFFGNVSTYLVVFMLFVLGIWVVVYSQKKGGQVSDEI